MGSNLSQLTDPEIIEIAKKMDPWFQDRCYLKTLFPEILKGMAKFRRGYFGRHDEKKVVEFANKWIPHIEENDCYLKFFDIVYYKADSKTSENGFIYTNDPGTVHINVDAFGIYGPNMLERVLAHELTHTLQYEFSGLIRSIESSEREVPYRIRWYEREASFVEEYVKNVYRFK